MRLSNSGTTTMKSIREELATNPSFRNQFYAAVMKSLKAKEVKYRNSQRDLSNRIVKTQLNVIRTLCNYGERKGDIYYIRNNGSLGRIQLDYSKNFAAFVDQVNENKSQYPEISNVIKTLYGKDEEDLTDYTSDQLSIFNHLHQCDTFFHDWITPAEKADEPEGPKTTEETARQAAEKAAKNFAMGATNQIAKDKGIKANPKEKIHADGGVFRGNGVWAALLESNQDFYQSLQENERIVAVRRLIAERISAIQVEMTQPTAGKALIAFQKALGDFQTRVLGRNDIKDNIARLCMAFINNPDMFKDQYLTFSLTGGPGTGKTDIAKYLGPILGSLGILVDGNYKLYSRATMVGQHIGETSSKVQSILKSNLENVMFIDEAYAIAMGNGCQQKYDSYGVEAINEIVGFLDKNKGQIALVVAGYRCEMDAFYFDVNPGMRRRFKYHWELNPFSATEMLRILSGMIIQSNLSLQTVATPDAIRFLYKFMNYEEHPGATTYLLWNVLDDTNSNVFYQSENKNTQKIGNIIVKPRTGENDDTPTNFRVAYIGPTQGWSIDDKLMPTLTVEIGKSYAFYVSDAVSRFTIHNTKGSTDESDRVQGVSDPSAGVFSNADREIETTDNKVAPQNEAWEYPLGTFIFRRLFQNEAGDMDTLCANIVQYYNSSGKIDVSTMLNILLDETYKRDGKAQIRSVVEWNDEQCACDISVFPKLFDSREQAYREIAIQLYPWDEKAVSKQQLTEAGMMGEFKANEFEEADRLRRQQEAERALIARQAEGKRKTQQLKSNARQENNTKEQYINSLTDAEIAIREEMADKAERDGKTRDYGYSRFDEQRSIRNFAVSEGIVDEKDIQGTSDDDDGESLSEEIGQSEEDNLMSKKAAINKIASASASAAPPSILKKPTINTIQKPATKQVQIDLPPTYDDLNEEDMNIYRACTDPKYAKQMGYKLEDFQGYCQRNNLVQSVVPTGIKGKVKLDDYKKTIADSRL